MQESPLYYFAGLQDSDHHKLIVLNQIHKYFLHLNEMHISKQIQFENMRNKQYFNNGTMDKNIYWNELKLYNRKIRQITSYYNYYLKHFIIESDTFCKIPLPCLEIVNQYL